MVVTTSPSFVPAERDALVFSLEMARAKGVAVLPDGSTIYSPMLQDPQVVESLTARLAALGTVAA